MFSSYFKIALRNLLNHKLYSLINVFGLAVGLAACLIIATYVKYEFSFDNFFPNSDRIYRFSADFAESGTGPARQVGGNLAPVAPIIAQADIPGVEAVARLGNMHALIGKDQQALYEDNFYWADSGIFDIFHFNWLAGDPGSAIDEPYSVVISESMAKKYFEDGDAVGQTLMLENTWPLKVTGVIGDVPENSHMRPDLIVSMDTAWIILNFNFETNWRFNWAYPNFHTYVLLAPGVGIDNVQSQVNTLFTDGPGADMAGYFGLDNPPFTAFRLSDIHLGSARPWEFRLPGSMASVVTFSAIAIGLLLIACINFMNLSTARSSRRAREVGLRKTIGAGRKTLVAQFLGESLLLTLFALCMAMAIAEFLLPVFGALVNRDNLNAQVFFQPDFLLMIFGITVVTGLVAGSYPAFYLSAFNPARVLKNDGLGSLKGITVRNLLVIFQFFLAISLIVATLVVFLQMRYVRNVELGFNKDQILVLWGTHRQGMGEKWEPLKQELLSNPDIAGIAEGDMAPGRVENRPVRIEGGPEEGQNILMKRIGMGFFAVHDIDVIAGRDFNEALSTDYFYPPPNVSVFEKPTGSYVLNETAVRELGWTPEQALGKTLEVDFSNNFSVTVAGPVIGVVEDVHVQSLRSPIQPLGYYVPPAMWGNQPSFEIASVRLTGNNIEQTLAYINEKWLEFNPDMPFVYHFLDSDFQTLYQEEERQGDLFTLFALLTIAIACLGLFGLASFTTERRQKEIGVRKVMGGSVWSIVLLLTNDFSKLVLIANVLAWPVAYFAMERWLENFAYRIDLTPLIFIGSGLIALCIAWVTVGGTAAKAASQKPVLALRYE